MASTALGHSFFNRDPSIVAVDLLGCTLQHWYNGMWLRAVIVETESYYLYDRASHASLGYTQKRSALFMPPGTIYMYYARGGHSLNISCRGKGNAVLIKAGLPDQPDDRELEMMHTLNPRRDGSRRTLYRLCSGQTLLCRSLHLTVPAYDRMSLPHDTLCICRNKQHSREIIQCLRLGIPHGRDENLRQRFVLKDYADSATKNPLRTRKKNSYRICTVKNSNSIREEIDWDTTAVKRKTNHSM